MKNKKKDPKEYARKLIRIGTSIGITIPKKLLKKHKAQIGDILKFKPINFIKIIEDRINKKDEE